jgi:hypothetical protein
MQEDYEVITSAAFSVMQANVANIRETVVNSQLVFRFHGDNADSAPFGTALQAESLRFVVMNINFHSQEGGGKRLPLRVGHQGKRAAATETFVQQKIKSAEIGQLKSFDLAFADACKMFLDALCCDFASQQRVEIISESD